MLRRAMVGDERQAGAVESRLHDEVVIVKDKGRLRTSKTSGVRDARPETPDSCPRGAHLGWHTSGAALRDLLRSGRLCRRAGGPGRPFPQRRHPL
jgi:hypothetical protein